MQLASPALAPHRSYIPHRLVSLMANPGPMGRLVARKRALLVLTLELGRDATGKRIQRTRRGFPTKKRCEAERAAELVDRRRGVHVEPSSSRWRRTSSAG
jgi:hypothetical protein